MSTLLTGVFDIMPVADGSQAFPTLDVSGALSQSYSGTTYFPDWKTNAALRPTVTPRCYDGVEGSTAEYGFVPGIATDAGEVPTANQQWFYNNTGIYWAAVSGQPGKYRSANFLSADGTTPLIELNYTNTAHPSITFIGNIPTSLSGGDDDVLKFVGVVAGLEDFQIEVSRTIRVSELVDGTGNKVDLIMNKTSFDNDSATNDEVTINVGAVINGAYVVGFSAINATGYKVSFANSIGIDSTYFRSGATTVPSSVLALTLHPSDIGGMGTVVCELLSNANSVVATVSETIKDLGDPDIVSFESFTVETISSTTAIEKRNGSVKKNEFLRCIAKVTNRTGEVDRTSNYAWSYAKILKKDGTEDTTETAKITTDASGHKVYVVGFSTAYSEGGMRFVCKATLNVAQS